jgi:hypothetical protein
MDLTKKKMSNFMTGSSLTGSEVYGVGMKYLKRKMPLSKCSQDDVENMVNNKWRVTFRE